MKKNEITIGATYIAKVSDKLVEVRIDAENSHGGWDATNLATKKKVRIKSAQRLRRPVKGAEKKSDAKAPAKHDPNLVPLSEMDKAKKRSAKTAKEKKPSGLDAAAKVLADAGEPMRCKDMVDKMLSDGLWKTGGKTPAATIYAAILREITTKGSAARFKKTDRGLFAFSGK